MVGNPNKPGAGGGPTPGSAESAPQESANNVTPETNAAKAAADKKEALDKRMFNLDPSKSLPQDPEAQQWLKEKIAEITKDQQEPKKNEAKSATDKAETDPAGTPKEQTNTKPEKAPVTAEQLALEVSKAETYVLEKQQREEKMREEQYGKGLWGKGKHFLNSTNIGKGLKIAGKIGIGAIGVTAAGTLTGGAGLLLAPLLFSKGAQLGIEGVGQGFQHIFGGKNRLDSENKQRELLTAKAKTLEEIRELPIDSPERQQKIVDLANEMSTIEKSLREEINKNVDWDKKWSKWINNTALVSTLAIGLTYGIPMGTQDFNPKDAEHAVRLGTHGFEFMYNAGEKFAQTTHAYLGGAVGHTLGGSIPKTAWMGLGLAAAGLLARTKQDHVSEASPKFELPGYVKQPPVPPTPGGNEPGGGIKPIEPKPKPTTPTAVNPGVTGSPVEPVVAPPVVTTGPEGVKPPGTDTEKKQQSELDRLTELAEQKKPMDLDTALQVLRIVDKSPTAEPEGFHKDRDQFLALDRKGQTRAIAMAYDAMSLKYHPDNLAKDDPKREIYQKILDTIVSAEQFLKDQLPEAPKKEARQDEREFLSALAADKKLIQGGTMDQETALRALGIITEDPESEALSFQESKDRFLALDPKTQKEVAHTAFEQIHSRYDENSINTSGKSNTGEIRYLLNAAWNFINQNTADSVGATNQEVAPVPATKEVVSQEQDIPTEKIEPDAVEEPLTQGAITQPLPIEATPTQPLPVETPPVEPKKSNVTQFPPRNPGPQVADQQDQLAA